jgi:hypothetical protein
MWLMLCGLARPIKNDILPDKCIDSGIYITLMFIIQWNGENMYSAFYYSLYEYNHED